MTQKLLRETIALMTSEAAAGVSEVATPKHIRGKVLLGVLIGAAVVGGVAAVVLSGGAATPAIIVALEAAGDVVVGTELVDVTMGGTP
ncbi:MAG: hypothetical protein JO308_05575 [Verrucomicrobia bacterium]|nr:hypothetical protein [Verrucomicrobiota bacterium]